MPVTEAGAAAACRCRHHQKYPRADAAACEWLIQIRRALIAAAPPRVFVTATGLVPSHYSCAPWLIYRKQMGEHPLAPYLWGLQRGNSRERLVEAQQNLRAPF